ncbi:hypothetical protein EHZ19_26840 [Paraburkholderia bannensis]|nr:hypothetical protein [Paraburkholderia bannensis]RQM44725.1 hypothetical protein EHZ19_26840 [Paraburkholderia bannensis]
MSDTNNEVDVFSAVLPGLQEVISNQGDALNALQENTMMQMSEITTLFTVVSFILASLPGDKRKLIENSLSDMIRNLPNREVAERMAEVLKQRMHIDV